VTVYEADLAREFRFDDARARYIVADYDPDGSPGSPGSWIPLGSPLLTDYDGVSPYLDGEVDMTTYGHTALRSYFGTAGHADVATGAEAYYHGDLIDSSMLTTDAAGASVTSVAYTAFGEPAAGASAPSSLDTRYQYAGSWGYESGLLGLQGANTDLPALTFQHLGWRWYQPDIGRFVQRDLIGIWGGLNVYLYVGARPTLSVDPSGLDDYDDAMRERENNERNNITDLKGHAGHILLGWLPKGLEGGVTNGVVSGGVGGDVDGNWWVYCSVSVPFVPGASAGVSVGSDGAHAGIGVSSGPIGVGVSTGGGTSVGGKFGPIEGGAIY
jgi:RHS repeat-associated protein